MIPSELRQKYIDAGWKEENGLIRGTDAPWISFEHPSGECMHYFSMREDGSVFKCFFNPNQEINLRVKKDDGHQGKTQNNSQVHNLQE